MTASVSKPNQIRRRPVANLSSGLEVSLSTYVIAALGGVGFVLAQSAEAKIIYTPATTDIPINGGGIPLDLNHDGIADFSFSNRTYLTTGRMFLLRAGANRQSNGIWGKGSWVWGRWSRFDFASALHAGTTVKSDERFENKGPWLMGWDWLASSFRSATAETYGQWLYTQHRYLGLKFEINGQAHYGWARFDVTVEQRGIQATLTGYAYETVPNKPIVTGKTKGPNVITLEPASLGRFALGASGISAWRRRQSATARQ